jgi:hypothetical protein
MLPDEMYSRINRSIEGYLMSQHRSSHIVLCLALAFGAVACQSTTNAGPSATASPQGTSAPAHPQGSTLAGSAAGAGSSTVVGGAGPTLAAPASVVADATQASSPVDAGSPGTVTIKLNISTGGLFALLSAVGFGFMGFCVYLMRGQPPEIAT